MLARRRPLVAALLSVLVTVGALVGVSTPAQAAGPQVYGRVTDASTGSPVSTVRVLLFDANWTYLKRVKVRGNGIYQLVPPGPGNYHLQFVDGRPAYNTKAYAARLDVRVRVGSGPVQKNVRMKRGGAIGGVVKVRGKRAAKAHIRAVSNGGQVIEVDANKKGEYALGGLAKDDYRVFAYDARNRRVGKSKLIRSVKLRTFRQASFNLTTKPGAIRGFLTLGGARARGVTYVTAVNKKSGEYWVKKVSAGNISLRGLTPGPYRLQVPDTNGYFGGSFTIGSVRAGGKRNVTIDLGTRGGTFTGQAVDKNGVGIPNISVRMTDAQGRVLDERPTNQDGTFAIGGTARQQGGVTVVVFPYSTIQGHTYQAWTSSVLTLFNNQDLSLGRITLQREPDPVTPTTTAPTTPAPTTPAPTTPAPTTPAPTTTAPTTPAPTTSTAPAPVA
ncbi:hypothetical protein IFT73_11940 [Aeromicrobium sp. CFBP 8757]|uniref:MSCRAMM family protein n=1 Tax=Aeromicrobium sp. CFBP 8757 TaxID=2775288 RepID=UPI0017833C1E|nr:hypothetical protein [Aeromicrobium sp. CFBP 8757]MBD8607571.1 hypothetical protein [Aeromicrobium sp. CFBP 8757]